MKLIDNAHLWHRLWSIRLLILTALYDGAVQGWHHLPDAWKPTLTSGEQWIVSAIGMALPAITGMAVLVKQERLPTSTPPSSTPPAAPHD